MPAPAQSRKKRATGKRWSGRVTRTSHAMDLAPGVFKGDDPKKIAASVLQSARRSRSRKAGPYRSALSMITFYINRAGTNLPRRRKEILQKAKRELKRIADRD